MNFTKTLAASAMIITFGTAQAEISGNIALGTDYMWRGVTQTDNQLAVSGGFDYTDDSGLYLGTWAGNVDFGPDSPSMELDLYGGFTGELGDGTGYDVGFIHYDYPSDSDSDTNELYLGITYNIFSAMVSYTNDYFGSDESALYFDFGAKMEIAEGYTLAGHIGHQSSDAFLPAADSYLDYSIGLSTSMGGVDLDLSYVDSNSDAEDIFGDGATDSRVVFTISKSL